MLWSGEWDELVVARESWRMGDTEVEGGRGES